MRKKLTLIAVAACIFIVAFLIDSAIWAVEKQTASRIHAGLTMSTDFSDFEKSATFCEITNDQYEPAMFYDGFNWGMGMAVYMDPGKCSQSPYPFRVTDVHLFMYEHSEYYIWPIHIQVNLRTAISGDKCLGPDKQGLFFSQTFTIPYDSSVQELLRPMNLSLSSPSCVTQPFFLEVVYLDSSTEEMSLPSPMMDLDLYPEDTCDNWFLHYDGEYYEWYDTWVPPVPGAAIIRATGYTEAPECADLWYWKPDKPDQEFPAPSGMPDFDQYQFGDSTSLCGPTAVANCLWWFNAVPEGMSPPDLVRLLSDLMHCRPYAEGTYVDSMQIGLQQYFEIYGFALQESTFTAPNFFEMEDSLKACQDIILLVGFWWWDGSKWWREGGHYVTMAGVCSESLKVAVSDPARDAAEGQWPGRVRPIEHPLHPGNYVLHNDPTYVSQDMYQSTVVIPSPSPGNPFWEIDYVWWDKISFAGMNVPVEFKDVTKTAPRDIKVRYATEVEYAVMICPKASAVGEDGEGTIIPRQFELQQNYPNPFNNETIIKFNLRRPTAATLTIYNILGQKVRTLVTGRLPAGEQTIRWDGKDQRGNDLSSGIYFYKLKAGEQTETKRLVLLK